ncbi:hypothetical protein XH98_14755 [Bradyrhizobium sp. CCBAU 51745]|uniref:Crp/Fnr family transcriptional regulator n=1 Tax=Bradyrhizobium sp. CCBAU 51745 TaxID=1325099 RepID=UPI0023065C9F|nr:Crp/Fnr family transcriptional regulator [Bradyrhizobium sp. CCBAU 51745]MDA9440356.1 hypothetical protein [Bradyrhizobium sp. CCBAU 51745]
MKHATGPAIHSVHPWDPGNPEKGIRHQLLSEDESAKLAKIAQIVRFAKGQEIYAKDTPAQAAFNIIDGVVVASDAEHVISFLYSGDLFGLSEEGRYANTTKAATPVTAYKMPMAAVRRILASNADIDVNLIIKLCEELRQAQRHAVLLAQKKAATKLAMFLGLQEHLQAARGEPTSEIHLEMDRSSIAAYLGITLEALSRAFRSLTSKKLISFRGRQHITVLDRDAFNQMQG